LEYSHKQDVIGQSRIHRKTGKTWEVQGIHDEVINCYNLAEAVLSSAPKESEQPWQIEWLEIQLARMYLYYWLSQVKEMEDLVAKTKPFFERYGTPLQRGIFFGHLIGIDYRRFRYLLPQKSLEYVKSGLEASIESENLGLICWVRFSLGFAYLWCDQAAKAQVTLQEALKESQKIGDVVNQARCLTYLTVAYRRQNKVELVEELIPKCIEIAEKAQMKEYVGTATANLAWVSWCRKENAKAEEQGQRAIEQWDQLPVDHASCAFKWTALFPLIGIAVKNSKYLRAVKYVKMLLDPKQKRLPDGINNTLEQAIEYWEADQSDKVSNALKESLELAMEMRYL
jgi:tetratricopeptide (TPR) repeat protein